MAKKPSKQVTNVETGTVTSSHTVTANTYAKKQENVINIYLAINGVTCSANDTIANLPSGFAPSSNMVVIGNDTDKNILFFTVRNSGAVQSQSALSNKDVRILFTIIT